MPIEILATHLLYLEVYNFDRVTSTDLIKQEDSKGITLWSYKTKKIELFFENIFQINEKKSSIITFFVKLTKKLFSMKSYNLIPLIHGIFTKFVTEEDFQSVSTKVLENWIELEDVMSARCNFKNYRNLITQNLENQKPCVPFLSLHLKDLTYICCSLPKVEMNIVPYEAVVAKGKIVQLLLRLKHLWQNYSFNLSSTLINLILEK